jgi:hypothetical protein
VQQLNDTRRRYNRMDEVMKAAEARMQPVLAAFKIKCCSSSTT